MTVVATLGIKGLPILIGDLLLSGHERLDYKFNLPTVGSVTNVFPEGSGFTPSGLSQKIAVVGSHLVISWAGSRIAAKSVISDLVKKNKDEPLTLDSLRRCFQAVDKLVWEQGVGFVGYIWDSLGIAHFGVNFKNITTTSFGEVELFGTGTDNIGELLSEVDLPAPPKGKEGKHSSYANSVALSLTGYFSAWKLLVSKVYTNFTAAGTRLSACREGSSRN